MKTYTSIIIICLLLIFFTGHLFTQNTKINEEDEKPYKLNSEGEEFSNTRGLFSRRSKVRKKNATTSYLTVFPGPNGKLENLTASELAQTGLQQQLKFPSLNFVLSAASKLLIGKQSKSGKIKDGARSLTELKQLSIKVKVLGYDKNKRYIRRLSKNRFGDDPVMVLSIFPSDSKYGQSRRPGLIQKSVDKVDAIAQHLGALGGIASKATAVFRTLFPAKDHISQIAYMDSVNAFGWIWREAEDNPIEGIHNCMALFRVHEEVKYLKVKVKLITDWKRFGAWVKAYDYFIPVKGENDI